MALWTFSATRARAGSGIKMSCAKLMRLWTGLRFQSCSRTVYENDDIWVQHMRADYPNGTKDATMHVSLKKDGLLWRSETGVTAVKT